MKKAWMRALLGTSAIGLVGVGVYAQKAGNTLYSLGIAGRGYGMGGAFVAIADDVSAAAWNPAGLAYLTRPELQIAMRTMPSYSTTQSGNAVNPTERTTGDAGSQQVSFFGVALPLGKGGGGILKNGTLGIAFWRGGFYENNTLGTFLTSGDPDSDLAINPRIINLRTQVNYYTLAFGWQLNPKLKAGVGLVYGEQKFDYLKNETIVDPNTDEIIGTTESAVNENGTGFGVQLGVIGKIGDKGNFGITYLSEIELGSFDDASTFASKIPARLSAGASYILREVKRGSGSDYLLGAIQFDHFFAANEGLTAATNDYTNFGAGLSYNLSYRGLILPLRVGFHNYQSGGNALFSNEQVFTFGIGVRPGDQRYSIDIDFGSSNRHKGLDFSLSVGYQFGED